MHGVVFLLCAAYTLLHNGHVRVDIFYSVMSDNQHALLNFGGTASLRVPMTIFLTISSWDYASTSWAIGEASREAGGLPYPFVPILKSLIPVTAIMLILQGIANSITAIMILTNQMPSMPENDVPQSDAI